MRHAPPPEGVDVLVPSGDRLRSVLDRGALDLLASLEREFRARRAALLARRAERQAAFDAGERPGFLAATSKVRAAAWTVAPIPGDLADRRVEITGPPDRKMAINALNSGANVYMADFEDACSPTFGNCIDGQINLRDAVRGTIRHVREDGKVYVVGEAPATLMVRPRGLHLVERHVQVDGRPVAASLFDFAVFFFHNARALVEKGSGPYFYLPKLESHLEARLWNDVFLAAQERLGLAPGTIRATVLVETLPAAFEMEEILHELRQHSAGLNCGRWDYIFSFIKTFRRHADCVLPDRSQVTMTTPFLRAYSRLAIRTCHRRGAHAMGGMAAQIPVKDPKAAEEALAKVRADKVREATDGHDGTWVAHPGLVRVAREVFDEHMPGPHQIGRPPDDLPIAADDLLRVPAGTITYQGLCHNVDVGIQYLEAWLGGSGCVPIYDLMEDAATAEIARAQVWQWIHHEGGVLDDGRRVTAEMCRGLVAGELGRRRSGAGGRARGRGALAGRLFEKLATDERLADFLTLEAYDYLDETGEAEERTA